MSQVAEQSITEDSKPTADQQPMTEEAFLASRIARYEERAKPRAELAPKSEPESEAQEPEVAPSQEGEQQPEVKAKDVLSKDVDELTDDEIAELAQRGKSGLLKRIAELTAKRKLAEEKAASLEAAIQQARQVQAAAQHQPVEDNPYRSIESIESIAEKRKELDVVIDRVEEALWNADGLSATDIAATFDGKDYTKAELRSILRNAQKAVKTYLPSRYQELVSIEQGKQIEVQLKQTVRKELPWMESEDDETKKRYEAMVNDPRLKKVKKLVPEIAPQIEYLVAHAANSMYGRKVIKDDAKPAKTPALTPPSNPSTTAAAPERSESRVDKSIKDIEKRFKETGSAQDFIALRAAQRSNRR